MKTKITDQHLVERIKSILIKFEPSLGHIKRLDDEDGNEIYSIFIKPTYYIVSTIDSLTIQSKITIKAPYEWTADIFYKAKTIYEKRNRELEVDLRDSFFKHTNDLLGIQTSNNVLEEDRN